MTLAWVKLSHQTSQDTIQGRFRSRSRGWWVVHTSTGEVEAGESRLHSEILSQKLCLCVCMLVCVQAYASMRECATVHVWRTASSAKAWCTLNSRVRVPGCYLSSSVLLRTLICPLCDLFSWYLVCAVVGLSARPLESG